jgi:glucose/arabinose dehydrogenase
MKVMRCSSIFLVTLLIAPVMAMAQNRIGTGPVVELYQQHCATCHGDELEGGLGSSLIDDAWIHGNSAEDIARVIREGLIEDGMVGYEEVLSDREIQSLVVYIQEMGMIADQRLSPPEPPRAGIFSSQHHRFRLEEVVSTNKGRFWSVSFLPDGALLLSLREGALYIARDGRLGDPIEGLPDIRHHGQGGLLEVQAHPDYPQNGWIYLSYSEEVNSGHFMTAIVRGRVDNGQWVDEERLFTVPPHFHRRSRVHFGTRFVFQDGYLFFTIGDRGDMQLAQQLDRTEGKVHRIHDDGRIPDDNPFVKQENALPTIWSYGHRNPQGLDRDPRSGILWSTEHGPRGGDELNVIQAAANYGWPVITHGINYNGTPITGKTAAPGMEQPVHYWTPSIAVCGIDFYEGDRFPQWKGDLFVTGLRSENLERFKIEGTRILEHEVVFTGEGRVRDVSTGPDGLLYVILNAGQGKAEGAIYRLVPEKTE